MEAQLLDAVQNQGERESRVARAKEITDSAHLYEHRAKQLVAFLNRAMAQQQRTTPEDRLAWIVGCGRTGSTWLTEMLGDVPTVAAWNEPYYGRFFRQLVDRPEDRKRPASFFSDNFHQVWKQGLRDAFYSMAQARYPQFGSSALVVKEVNTPEFFPMIQELFPASKMILLLRDPFDILDSYIDMHRPGSWNRKAGEHSLESIMRWAEHIRVALTAALDAYEVYPPDQRLKICFEDLLRDPVQQLCQCCGLFGVELSADKADEIVKKHSFDQHAETGKLAFRRFGKAGIWKESGNFSEEIREVADSSLGGLRTRLGLRH